MKSKKGTWPQAVGGFFGPLLAIVLIRWLLIEPFVIPSGSMIPNLLIHDHILVNKLSFGIHLPFGKTYLLQWAAPTRGQVVVFRFPENPDVFYIKRVIAVAGETIEVKAGQVYINEQMIPQISISAPVGGEVPQPQFEYNSEGVGPSYTIRHLQKKLSHFGPVTVPAGHFFVMGDNRDQSSDSRVWGFVPQESTVGIPLWIWLSCDNTLVSAQFVCDPQSIRWSRILKKVE